MNRELVIGRNPLPWIRQGSAKVEDSLDMLKGILKHVKYAHNFEFWHNFIVLEMYPVLYHDVYHRNRYLTKELNPDDENKSGYDVEQTGFGAKAQPSVIHSIIVEWLCNLLNNAQKGKIICQTKLYMAYLMEIIQHSITSPVSTQHIAMAKMLWQCEKWMLVTQLTKVMIDNIQMYCQIMFRHLYQIFQTNGNERQKLKGFLLSKLSCERLAVAACISSVGKYEIIHNEWETLLEALSIICDSKKTASSDMREIGVTIWRNLIQFCGASLKKHFDIILNILKQCLNDEKSLKTQVESVKAIGLMVEFLENDNEIGIIENVIPNMCAVIERCLKAGDEENVLAGMEVFNDLAESKIAILNKHSKQLVQFNCSIANSKGKLPLTIRWEPFVIEWRESTHALAIELLSQIAPTYRKRPSKNLDFRGGVTSAISKENELSRPTFDPSYESNKPFNIEYNINSKNVDVCEFGNLETGFTVWDRLLHLLSSPEKKTYDHTRYTHLERLTNAIKLFIIALDIQALSKAQKHKKEAKSEINNDRNGDSNGNGLIDQKKCKAVYMDLIIQTFVNLHHNIKQEYHYHQENNCHKVIRLCRMYSI